MLMNIEHSMDIKTYLYSFRREEMDESVRMFDRKREILLSLVNGSRSSDVIEKLCISSATYYRQVRTIKQIIRGEKKDV